MNPNEVPNGKQMYKQQFMLLLIIMYSVSNAVLSFLRNGKEIVSS